MKTKIKLFIMVMTLITIINTSLAQKKSTVAVLNIESKGVIPNSEAVTFMVWLEYEKTGVYNVIDKNDVSGTLRTHQVSMDTCQGRMCLAEVGRLLSADKVITGSVNRFGEKIAVNIKIINSNNGEIEKSNTMEFQNLPEIQKMIEITVKTLEGIKTDPKVVNLLIAYDKPVENANTKISLSGPRIGFYHTDGYSGDRLRQPEKIGGFDMYKVNTSIGWQQEMQILSAGDFQALAEFVFLINGLESSRFMPSLTTLVGFRSGQAGWEFALGPSFRFIRQAKGFFGPALDEDKNIVKNENEEIQYTWYLEKDLHQFTSQGIPATEFDIIKNLDSRGDITLSTGFVVAAGRTFKSGYLNIPVNVYYSPRKTGSVYGLSLGFNIIKRAKTE